MQQTSIDYLKADSGTWKKGVIEDKSTSEIQVPYGFIKTFRKCRSLMLSLINFSELSGVAQVEIFITPHLFDSNAFHSLFKLGNLSKILP